MFGPVIDVSWFYTGSGIPRPGTALLPHSQITKTNKTRDGATKGSVVSHQQIRKTSKLST